jgi:dynein light chain 1
MISLPKLKNLKILSLGRNNIKRIMGLEDIGQTLEQLWMSYNIVEKLDGLQPCIKLHTLFLSNNKIAKWEEIAKLDQLNELKNKSITSYDSRAYHVKLLLILFV